MWSKTKQILENRLADELKGRVRYGWDVYRRLGMCSTECHVMSIFVDGECWFHTDQRFWKKKYGSDRLEKNGDMDIIRETGLVDNYYGDTISGYIHEFLNVLSIDEAISHENYFIRLLAVLDKRVGKRRLRKLVEHIDDEPEWFSKWILLRAGATGRPT